MDLGYGVTGHMDAGAGSIFLIWNEGHWSFSTRNHNSEEGSKEMIALAKQIVRKLESQMLPGPACNRSRHVRYGQQRCGSQFSNVARRRDGL